MKRKSLTSTTLFALTTAALSFVPSAKAQKVILYTSLFDGPTYTDGDITTSTLFTAAQTPGQDGWLASSGTTTTGTDLNIAVSNSATNGFITLGTSGQDIRHLFNGGQTVGPGSSVWFDADVTVTSVQTAGDYAIHLSDGGTSNFNARTFFKADGSGGFEMALGTGSGTATYGTSLTLNQTYHILVRYDIVAGTANDTGALYVNPTTFDGSGDTPYIAATTVGTDATTTLSAIAFRQGSASSAAGMKVDNLEVFTEAPEPGTIAALLGGFALLGLRRRQRPSA